MKKSFATDFFGRMRGDFNISPQGYHSVWKRINKPKQAFVGPSDYAGITSGGLKSKFVSPQEQPKSASVQRGGFISPVNDIKITKQKIYKSGANRTQALSEE